MSKHTPTPWESQNNVIFGDVDNPEHDGDSPYIGKLEGQLEDDNKANAAHIVKCVNVHDELLEALKGLLDELSSEEMDRLENSAILRAVYAAIAKAEGRNV